MAVFTKGLYNCACARTVCDWSCTTYATMMSGLVPNTVVGYVPPLKKTNADRIRGMTDEELADWLYDWAGGAPNCDRELSETPDNKTCRDCWMAWLKSPVEEVEE